jgi:ABC-type nitrate/sulfonate/bicarbonate transport system ATPase subunit
LEIKNLSKMFSGNSGFNINLINNLSLTVTKGTITSFLAPFGSGKSTLLKIIAGLESQTGGEILLPPHHKVVFIPSDSSSFPWFSVNENFSLVSDKQELKNEIIKLLGLTGYENHHPNNKSRGFRFLIAIGMALLSEADIILIDEPFLNLSDLMKEKVFRILRNVAATKKVTLLFATSNLSDSIIFSDMIMLLKKNPLAVIKEIGISFSGERNLELLKSTEFDDYKKQITDLYNINNVEKVINLSF